MKKDEYYTKKLFATKLKLAYEIASSRIQQYLEEEIKFVLSYIKSSDTVLEIGCGYGRVLARLAEKAETVMGIDTAKNSLEHAKDFLSDYSNVKVFHQTARNILLDPNSIDVVVAIQNPISAFKIDPQVLVKESLKVAKKGGTILISSYSKKIWKERLKWFEEQSAAGLLGEIDYSKTIDGTIVCKDGFTATTFTTENFHNLIESMNLNAIIEEVDDSSIFCIITADK